MNIPELRAELEAEQAWRRAEILFFQNQSGSLPVEEERSRFRRALVLLLYAHFEGFCRFALQLYVNAVNKAGITCGEANYALAAASLSDLFAALRDPNKKCDLFRNALPDDAQLHRFARDREFLQNTGGFSLRPLHIPDHVVDTESNLKPIVLRKNLFRLGLDYNQFQSFEGDIHRLLNYRNKIAHGESRSGIEQGEYESLRGCAFRIMDGVTVEVASALQGGQFQRKN